MLKVLLPLVFIVAIHFCTGCFVPKVAVKYNAIDSVIRIVNPDHNCGCDYKDKGFDLYLSNKGKRNLYYWQSVYTKNLSNADLLVLGEKTRTELIKLVPELSYYRRMYIEFREPQVNPTDTVFKFKNTGVAYFIKDKCKGYKEAVTAKALIKKSHNKKFEASLCK